MNEAALITGASSGIGRELARVHAISGGDVILVARSENALEELKKELEGDYGVKAMVIVADLSDPASADGIFAQTQSAGITVDVLMNNAGYGGYGRFNERELTADLVMMQVNMGSLVALTHHYLKGMIERNKGKILHVASTAGMMPGPYQAVYYASKAFVISFSQAIAEELRETRVTSTVLCPGAVATGFAKSSDLDGLAVFDKAASPESVATIGYAAMQEGRLLKVNEGALGFVLDFVFPLLPRKAVLAISRKSMEKSS